MKRAATQLKYDNPLLTKNSSSLSQKHWHCCEQIDIYDVYTTGQLVMTLLLLGCFMLDTFIHKCYIVHYKVHVAH